MATVIFKPTEACNAKCAYCDVVHKDSKTPGRMSYETLELFFSRMNEFLVERAEEQMEVIWHGGEPLLLGPDYFRKASELQQKHCPETSDRIRHSIQSNLTLLTRELVGALKTLGITSVGTSYDPIDNVRGLGQARDSHQYKRKFLDAISLLDEEGVSWGLIYVVTKLSLADPIGVFQKLVNLSPKGAFMFNPVLLYGQGNDHLRLTPQEYVEFLGKVFPVWWELRSEIPNVEPFSSLVRNLVEDRPSLGCGDSGECAYRYLNVLPDGSLSHCGRSADWGLLDYGSINTKSFSEALADPQRETLARRNEVLLSGECKGCCYWNICHGGCPLDSWSANKSFLHRSEWCYSKKGFLKNYVEPVITGKQGMGNEAPEAGSASAPLTQDPLPILRSQPGVHKNPDKVQWINPVGGLGDVLMLSGVLKQVYDRDPSRKFNLVERTKYWPILEGHPAIAKVGNPPAGAEFITTAYWSQQGYQQGQRAYQVLAEIFGLQTPVAERLYVPWTFEDDPILIGALPRKEAKVVICQSSDSPRKQMSVEKWESLVAMLTKAGIGVVQVGRARDPYIRGAFNLLGLTSSRQLISLLRHFDVVVTSDSFAMHAAKVCDTPAVVLWGPTKMSIYGYDGHVHLQSTPNCDTPGGCIGPNCGEIYSSSCPHGKSHCVDTIPVESIYNAVVRILNGKSKVAAGADASTTS